MSECLRIRKFLENVCRCKKGNRDPSIGFTYIINPFAVIIWEVLSILFFTDFNSAVVRGQVEKTWTSDQINADFITKPHGTISVGFKFEPSVGCPHQVNPTRRFITAHSKIK